MKIKDVQLDWLGHSGFRIKTSENNKKIIYIDPYQLSDLTGEKADIILITHGHYDHCSIEDIQKIIKNGTTIICPPDVQSKATRFREDIKLEISHIGDELNIGNIRIKVVPAYNLNKPFHDKSESWGGYIIKLNDVVIYHAGDTDKIPEMSRLTGHGTGKEFIALLPVGGRFTMDAEEAAEAAEIIKPDLAIPIHWGNIIGDKKDAEEFFNLCEEKGIKAQILDKK